MRMLPVVEKNAIFWVSKRSSWVHSTILCWGLQEKNSLCWHEWLIFIYYHLTNLICGRLNMKIPFYYFLHLTCIFDFIFNFFLKIAIIMFLYTTIIVELKSNTKLRSTWTLQSEKNCRLWICLLAKCEYQQGLYHPIPPRWYHPESIRQLGLFASVHPECKLTTEESSAWTIPWLKSIFVLGSKKTCLL